MKAIPKNWYYDYVNHVMRNCLLRPLWGSVKLVSTKFTNLMPVEQFHQKPMGMYDCGLSQLANLGGLPLYIPKGL